MPLWLLPAEAAAKKPADACERIKPEQQLSTETSKAVDTMIEAGMTGLGRGKVDVQVETTAEYDTSLLAGDALAKAWYTYQLCVLKETEAITPTVHEELMRKAWGLEPAANAPVNTVETTGGAAIAGTGNMTFLPTEGKATIVLAQCAEKGKMGNPKPLGIITWKVNGQKKGSPQTVVGTAVDVQPGRLSSKGATAT